MSNFNDLTPRAQQVLALARKRANSLNHSYVGTEHIALGMCDLDRGLAIEALQACGVASQKWKEKILQLLEASISDDPPIAPKPMPETRGSYVPPQNQVPPPPPPLPLRNVSDDPPPQPKSIGRVPDSKLTLEPVPQCAIRETRYYILVDMGTQWTTKLARIEVGSWHETPKKGPSVRREEVVTEFTEDVPSSVCHGAFLKNVYGRQQFAGSLRLRGEIYIGWSLSKAEHERVTRLIALATAAAEFEKLNGYTV